MGSKHETKQIHEFTQQVNKLSRSPSPDPARIASAEPFRKKCIAYSWLAAVGAMQLLSYHTKNAPRSANMHSPTLTHGSMHTDTSVGKQGHLSRLPSVVRALFV